jgi:hypothetical protein
MDNALDAFRAQREAVDQVHARLTEVSRLLEQLTRQVDAVAGNVGLRSVLHDEENWLRQAQQLLADVRYFREQERLRFSPGVWRRWVLAVLFALASAAVAGTSYGWWIEPCGMSRRDPETEWDLAAAITGSSRAFQLWSAAATKSIRLTQKRLGAVQQIEEAAARAGMSTMALDGLRKCVTGHTTPDEVRRVTLEG